MRVVYFGSGEFAVPTLRWLVNSPHELAMVVTQPDRPAGRGKRVRPTAVTERAAIEGIEAVRCENVNDPEMVARLVDLRAELGIVAAFGQKMHEPVLSAFRYGSINLHGSLLPKYRGAAPINHAILYGEEITGVTVFRIVEKMDAGPILLQRQTRIAPTETSGELHDRLAGICCDAIGATLKLLEENPTAPGKPQDKSQVTYAPKLKKSDGYLRFEESAEALALRVRAMWPWPGGRCCYLPRDPHPGHQPVELTVANATAIPADSPGEPGVLSEVLTVHTGAGMLEIHSVQPAGKREMSWQDFINGRHVQPGDRLQSLSE